MSNFAIRGSLVVMTPMTHTLRGLCFEGSDYDARSFYVSYFFLPLFIPRDYLVLTFGERIRCAQGGDRWNLDDVGVDSALRTAIVERAVPFLSTIRTIQDMIAQLVPYADRRNVHAREAIAYAFARIGDQRARAAIQDLERSLDCRIAWQAAMAGRAQTLLEMLRLGPAAVQEQLNQWQAHTISRLALTGLQSVQE